MTIVADVVELGVSPTQHVTEHDNNDRTPLQTALAQLPSPESVMAFTKVLLSFASKG